jgi:carbamoyl-phosphate synthase small subunit
MEPVPASLVLDDGRTFRGVSFGAQGQVRGPLLVDTSTSGYQEGLTDPARAGAILVATAPHIGNTGWNDEDLRSPTIQAVGYVVRDPSPRPSSWRSQRTLVEELVAQGVVGIAGVDTRALTRHLRDHPGLGATLTSGQAV